MTNTTAVGAVRNRLAELEHAGNDSALIDARCAPCRVPTNRNTDAALPAARAGGAITAGHAFGRGLGFSGNSYEKRPTHG